MSTESKPRAVAEYLADIARKSTAAMEDPDVKDLMCALKYLHGSDIGIEGLFELIALRRLKGMTQKRFLAFVIQKYHETLKQQVAKAGMNWNTFKNTARTAQDTVNRSGLRVPGKSSTKKQ